MSEFSKEKLNNKNNSSDIFSPFKSYEDFKMAEDIIGKNFDKYIKKFKSLEGKEKKEGFNWSCFVLGPYWCLYRKCYMMAVCMLLIELLIAITINNFFKDLLGNTTILVFTMFIFAIRFAFAQMADYLYYNRVLGIINNNLIMKRNDIKQLLYVDSKQNDDFLKRKYKTSILALIIGGAIFGIPILSEYISILSNIEHKMDSITSYNSITLGDLNEDYSIINERDSFKYKSPIGMNIQFIKENIDHYDFYIVKEINNGPEEVVTWNSHEIDSTWKNSSFNIYIPGESDFNLEPGKYIFRVNSNGYLLGEKKFNVIN